MKSDEERRKYEGDVFYDVWRSGGNPDRIDYDRVTDSRYDGLDAEAAAYRELEAQRPREQQMEDEEYRRQLDREEPNDQPN